MCWMYCKYCFSPFSMTRVFGRMHFCALNLGDLFKNSLFYFLDNDGFWDSYILMSMTSMDGRKRRGYLISMELRRVRKPLLMLQQPCPCFYFLPWRDNIWLTKASIETWRIPACRYTRGQRFDWQPATLWLIWGLTFRKLCTDTAGQRRWPRRASGYGTWYCGACGHPLEFPSPPTTLLEVII